MTDLSQTVTSLFSKVTNETKKTLRHKMRRERQALSAPYRSQKARELLKTVGKLPEFRSAHRIAFYWPENGEIDPIPILNLALKMGKRCYLPVLHPSKKNHLLFVEYHMNDTLHLNRYGIYEPSLGTRAILPAWMLNIIFIPLLAFDKEGRRLGMGGGYYDRTLSDFKNLANLNLTSMSPAKLMGLAYEFQQLNHLPKDDWDLKLSSVATEKNIYYF